jgi:hypothetical protein
LLERSTDFNYDSRISEHKRGERRVVLRLLLHAVTDMVLRLQGFLNEQRYRPEAHYMRGPGPKSLARAETQPPADPE